MSNVLEVSEGKQYQTSDEILVYAIDTANWGGSPTSPSVKVYDEKDETDVTSTVMPAGSASVTSDTITLPPLKALTKGRTYRVEVKYVNDVNTFECFFIVECVR